MDNNITEKRIEVPNYDDLVISDGLEGDEREFDVYNKSLCRMVQEGSNEAIWEIYRCNIDFMRNIIKDVAHKSGVPAWGFSKFDIDDVILDIFSNFKDTVSNSNVTRSEITFRKWMINVIKLEIKKRITRMSRVEDKMMNNNVYYKIGISNTNSTNIAKSEEVQRIVDTFNGIYDVELEKHEVDNENELLNNYESAAYGKYFKNLAVASKFTAESDAVVNVMKQALNVKDENTLLLLNINERVLDNIDADEVVSALKNLTNKDYLNALVPFKVDYVAIITPADEDIEISKKIASSIPHDAGYKGKEIGIRTVDIIVVAL